MTGIIKIVDNNEGGTILENNTSNSDTSTSTPSYGGYNYDYDLISSSSSIEQMIIPSFEI